MIYHIKGFNKIRHGRDGAGWGGSQEGAIKRHIFQSYICEICDKKDPK